MSSINVDAEYTKNYRVAVTKNARKQGLKLGLSYENLDSIISQIKRLCYWPDNKDEFEYEKAFEAFEFKFNGIENKWIRVFAYQDDVRKTMWIIKVMAKKQNALTTADKIGIQAAVSMIEQDIREFEKMKKRLAQIESLKLLNGGKNAK